MIRTLPLPVALLCAGAAIASVSPIAPDLAWAQATTPAGAAGAPPASPDPRFPRVALREDALFLASTLEGTRVHARRGIGADGAPVWDDIGEIGDVAIDAQGRLVAVIVDVGGIIGLAERSVPVAWPALSRRGDGGMNVDATPEELDAALALIRPPGG